MRWHALLMAAMVMFALCGGANASNLAIATPTKYAPINGYEIAYRTIGEGPPILLATRFRGTLDTWDPLFLDLLARRHRVITFDYPGVGYSKGTMPADLQDIALTAAALARHLKIDKLSMLGWSWGGLVTQKLAIERPDLVTAVILLATNPPGDILFSSTEAFLERAVRPTNDLADEEVLFFEPADAQSRAAARRSHDRIYARPGVTERIPSRMDQFQPYFVVAKAFREDAENLRGSLLQLPTPKLIVTGDNDTSTQGQNWFPLMGQLRNAQLVMYSQTGHAPQHQHPDRVVEQIEKFLESAKADEDNR